MELRFVDAADADFALLAKKLDDYYFTLVGDVHLRYAKYNDPALFGCRVVAYMDGQPVGIGAWKRANEQTAEVKRIYVEPEARRQGVATAVIRAVERDLAAHGYTRIILETAPMTEDSASLYLGLGYRKIDYYGSPAGAANCLCFEKRAAEDGGDLEIRFVEQTDADLAALSGELDRFYLNRFGDAYLAYKPHNALTGLAGAAVAYTNGRPAGCCCWRPLDAVTAEIKRVYVRPDSRRQGVARRLAEEVERHAAASGCHRVVLETAKETAEAVAFYRGIGYHVLEEGYGPYTGDTDCMCFEKEISDGTMR